MAKNKQEQILPTGKVKEVAISDEMKSSYINYAMSVIVSRALPDVRDGLKPSQRRILVAMHDLNLAPNGRFRKCAKIAGDTSGNYHPHGEAIVYPTLVKMAQDFNMRYMLVDGQGNFGSIDGDNPAAMRYTEARMSKYSWEMMKNIKERTVDFIPTYDGSRMEPWVLPSSFPNLLCNGSDGIAVGMATKIPPHNLNEISDAIITMINKGNKWEPNNDKSQKDKFKYPDDIRKTDDLGTLTKNRLPSFRSDLTVEDLIEIVPGPDFPTGAHIYDKKATEEMYSTGRGRIVMRAIATIEETKGGKFQIIITEIPYQVNKARLVQKIASLVKTKKVEGISDIRDETNKDGIRIVIDIKRDGKPNTILNKLYKYTEMQKAFNANMLALVNGEPRVLTLKRMLELFIKHRQEIVIRRTEFDLAKSREREHILEGLMIALEHLDEVIETIKKSKDAEVAKINLMKKFKLSEIQAQAILDMQLRRLAALERQKIEDEYKEIKKKIADLLLILNTPEKVLKIIKDEMTEIKEKLGDKRRTKVYKGRVGEFDEEDLVASEDVLVTVSEQGYIKRMKLGTYTVQKRGGKGKKGATTKEGDVVAHLFKCNTHDDILFFTNKGRVFHKKVYEVPEFGRTAKGQAIINLINIEQEELVTSILTKTKEGVMGEDMRQESQEQVEREGKEYKYLFMATKKGTVKKTAIDQFESIRASGLIAIKLTEGDELTWVRPTTGKSEVVMITKHARSIHFSEKDVRETGRATMGVRGIKFRDPDDEVIAMDVIRKEEDFALVISENGIGKITLLKEYPMQKRGGQGVYTARLSKKTGNLAAARILDRPHAELLIMSEEGQAVRIPTDDLPQRSRQTAGVKLMNVKKGDNVAAIAII